MRPQSGDSCGGSAAAASESATSSARPRPCRRTSRPSRPLEALHNQKLWQNNRHKQYYSGITDILRTYIAARWGIGAMEMTSDEIIAALQPVELPDKARMDLTAILRVADLVKFAKAAPEAEENEACYLKAYYFVEETKLVEEDAPAEGPDPTQP